jgi:hypothetical protein
VASVAASAGNMCAFVISCVRARVSAHFMHHLMQGVVGLAVITLVLLVLVLLGSGLVVGVGIGVGIGRRMPRRSRR